MEVLRQFTAGLRRELRPMPDRLAGTLRITAAFLMVLVVMLTFRNKVIGLGGIMVFILMQRSTLMTTMTEVLLLPALLVASLMITFIAMVAWDIAWLRIVLFAAMFWGGFWTMARSPLLGGISMVALSLVSVLIFDFDKYPYPNQIIGELGWLWVGCGMSILATVIVQRVTRAPSGLDVVRGDIRRLLGCVEEACLARSFGRTVAPGEGRIAPSMARDSGAMLLSLERLGKAKILTPRQKENCRALIDASEAALVSSRDAGCSLASSCWRSAAMRFRRLRERAFGGDLAPHTLPRTEEFPSGILPELEDAERSIGILPPDSESRQRLSRPFPPPEFGNAEFASRATLAAMACYLFASLTDWSGIHTCMITCVVTALSRLEAQSSKQFQRLLGATIGGVMSLVAMVWLIPATNELTGVLLILAGGTAICAWCASGRERVSYVGLQMGVAFYLTVLQDPHATTNLDPLRDRLVGIYVGIMAMRYFFSIPIPWRTAPC
jgi:multidrug resistance protein MdtO